MKFEYGRWTFRVRGTLFKEKQKGYKILDMHCASINGIASMLSGCLKYYDSASIIIGFCLDREDYVVIWKS